jgi:hypothetical protein
VRLYTKGYSCPSCQWWGNIAWTLQPVMELAPIASKPTPDNAGECHSAAPGSRMKLAVETWRLLDDVTCSQGCRRTWSHWALRCLHCLTLVHLDVDYHRSTFQNALAQLAAASLPSRCLSKKQAASRRSKLHKTKSRRSQAAVAVLAPGATINADSGSASRARRCGQKVCQHHPSRSSRRRRPFATSTQSKYGPIATDV